MTIRDFAVPKLRFKTFLGVYLSNTLSSTEPHRRPVWVRPQYSQQEHNTKVTSFESVSPGSSDVMLRFAYYICLDCFAESALFQNWWILIPSYCTNICTCLAMLSIRIIRHLPRPNLCTTPFSTLSPYSKANYLYHIYLYAFTIFQVQIFLSHLSLRFHHLPRPTLCTTSIYTLSPSSKANSFYHIYLYAFTIFQVQIFVPHLSLRVHHLPRPTI